MEHFSNIYEENEFLRKECLRWQKSFEFANELYQIKKKELDELRPKSSFKDFYAYRNQKIIEKMNFLKPDFSNIAILN